MVLYQRSKQGFKPVKTNWVMHQYHLGTEEDERDGELVVSKIFYQTQVKQMEECSASTSKEDFDQPMASVSPRTPKTRTPNRKVCRYGEGNEDKAKILTAQVLHTLFLSNFEVNGIDFEFVSLLVCFFKVNNFLVA